MTIIKNSIKCNHCGDEIESKTTHDLVMCSCGKCGVDGGTSYQRVLCENYDDFENTSVFEEINPGAKPRLLDETEDV